MIIQIEIPDSLPALQAHMKAALQTIVDRPNLSSDVFEVVSKSLKG